ncbi:ECF transporter S component [Mycoplasma sp. ATU-Cv-703]|uniref:ECF transporter S component n=1 Tax=Mycoplasma sp. ATU-Cv-703 TaxID=2498595 RepID=UPI000FDDDD59
MWVFWKSVRIRAWNIRKIAFVSILISTSVTFILIFSSVIPIAALPSFKITLAGLPIKLTGYIFGPFIGAITGIASDIISFMFRPTFLHWWYTLAFALVGLIPGVIGYIFNRRWLNKQDVDKLFTRKYIDSNFLVTVVILLLILVGVTTFVVLQGDQVFERQELITNKWVFLGISMFGISTMLIGIFVFRFALKPRSFNGVIPIIAFSAILEICTTPILTLGDVAVWGYDMKQFVTLLTGHLILTPAKIWFNLFVIYFAYKIVSPLIYNKTSNGW